MTFKSRVFQQLRKSDGFTLMEMLIATGIMVAVTAATFALMNPAQGTFAAQPEVMDMQQRLRVGVDTLRRELLMTGGGAYSGSMTGSLGNYFSPILPFRVGNVNADAPGTFFTDRITLLYVPTTPAQTSISQPMPVNSSELKVNDEPGCPKSDALCGFKQGMVVLIMDDSGAWDTFTVTEVQSPALHIQHRGSGLNKSYGAGSYITQVNMYTYWLKTDTVSGTYQLMRYDGDQTDTPVVDNVVGLSFEYYGEPSPPQLRPGLSPPTTYGPKPPALGVDNAGDVWGAGENCVFTVAANGTQVPRLDWLGDGNDGLIKLTQSQLTDGPWCPDAADPGRYDADLLRIRKVKVTLRVQASDVKFRGAAGALFKYGGRLQSSQMFLPDQEIKFDVSPRNLNLGR
jgi:hypothetical protein